MEWTGREGSGEDWIGQDRKGKAYIRTHILQWRGLERSGREWIGKDRTGRERIGEDGRGQDGEGKDRKGNFVAHGEALRPVGVRVPGPRG